MYVWFPKNPQAKVLLLSTCRLSTETLSNCHICPWPTSQIISTHHCLECYMQAAEITGNIKWWTITCKGQLKLIPKHKPYIPNICSFSDLMSSKRIVAHTDKQSSKTKSSRKLFFQTVSQIISWYYYDTMSCPVYSDFKYGLIKIKLSGKLYIIEGHTENTFV